MEENIHTSRLCRSILMYAVGCSLLFLTHITHAQKADGQFWFEGMVNYPFANVYNLETAFTSSTTLTESPKWRDNSLQFTLERSFSPYVDLQVASMIASSIQNDSLSSRELRGMIGVHVHLTPNSRILTRVLLRFENRHFLNTETDTWSSSNRQRLRVESVVPFNKPTMFSGDKLWYGIFDVEAFIVVDQNVEERYANRFRIRAAVGYRLNYAWRYELMYTLQESQNEIGAGFLTADNIFRVRVKYFLHKAKPVKEGIDNGN